MKVKLIVKHHYTYIDENGKQCYTNKPNPITRECLTVLVRRTWFFGLFRETLRVSIGDFNVLELSIDPTLVCDQNLIKAFEDFMNTKYFTVREVKVDILGYRLNLVYRKDNRTINTLSALQDILGNLCGKQIYLYSVWN